MFTDTKSLQTKSVPNFGTLFDLNKSMAEDSGHVPNFCWH